MENSKPVTFWNEDGVSVINVARPYSDGFSDCQAGPGGTGYGKVQIAPVVLDPAWNVQPPPQKPHV